MLICMAPRAPGCRHKGLSRESRALAGSTASVPPTSAPVSSMRAARGCDTLFLVCEEVTCTRVRAALRTDHMCWTPGYYVNNLHR